MTTQRQADLVLAHHQHELLKNDNLSYLSVVPRLDENGGTTRDYYVEAGVIRLNVQEDAVVGGIRDTATAGNEEPVPSRLPIPSESDAKTLGTEYVQVEVVESGEITALSFADRR